MTDALRALATEHPELLTVECECGGRALATYTDQDAFEEITEMEER